MSLFLAGRVAIALAGFLAAVPSYAGPPFLTDDPEPTEPGHWEIYAPLLESSGTAAEYEGNIGAEVNYGAAPGLQLTVGIPLGFAHDSSGSALGRGDLELSAKYRFYHDEAQGLSIAFFPGLTLPTGSHGMGSGKATGLLPIWAQKNSGRWSYFGGGGYALNPGKGNRNYWTVGAAVARQVSDGLLLGIEADREGSAIRNGRATTSLGVGTIVQLHRPFRLLASAGPTFEDGGSTSAHGFLALGIDF